MVSLFLMTEKGFRVLSALIDVKLHDLIDVVVIGRDEKVENDYHQSIVTLCQEHDIDFQYHKDEISMKSAYAIAVSWRWMIESNKETKLIVLHDSLLPKYRGFAPLVNALINGERQIGVTALYASENYDQGSIIAQERIRITYPLKIQQAINQICTCYEKLVVHLFNKIKEKENITGIPQNHDLASYSLWRDNKDYAIDWNNSAEFIVRFINAVSYPYKGASTYLNDKLIRIDEAEEVADVEIINRDVGKVIFMQDGKPVVVCKSGLIKIIKAIYVENNLSIFPLKKFRSRFS